MAATAKAGPSPDDIMSPGEMKPLLAKSKVEPVNCALGLTEAKEGVVLLHKKDKPKKLLKVLKAEAATVKLQLQAPSLRFGTAEVDPDIDPVLVRFRVNKEPPGAMEPRIREHIKKSGFSKVLFVVDPKLEDEPEDDTDGAPAAASPSAPGPQTDAKAPPDWDGLKATLTGLVERVQQMAGGDKTALQELAGLAKSTGDLVKGKADYQAASDAVAQLRDRIAAAEEKPPQQPQTGQQDGAGAILDRASQAWVIAQRRVAAEVAKLRAAIVEAYAERGLGPKLEAAYRDEVEWVLQALDERVTQALAAVAASKDPAKRPALVAEAKGAMGDYAVFLRTDKTVQAFEANPFLKASIRGVLDPTLSTLSKALV